jgi:lipopolysaccharide/colanic/teichoic acid biosynthesis glycosyltransferase
VKPKGVAKEGREFPMRRGNVKHELKTNQTIDATRRIKRALDMAIAAIGLALTAPILLVVAVLVLFHLGRPVIFRQQRPGYLEQPFCVYKFRTMISETHSNGRILTDAERTGRLGRVLRKTSLDELPQLWNVLLGDMSLVGPRPLLMKYLPYFTEEERLRFNVRPGITGWAQIRGRNQSSWSRRLADDVWYVRNWSLALDIRILLLTVQRVLRSEGVVLDEHGVLLDLDEERIRAKEQRSA